MVSSDVTGTRQIHAWDRSRDELRALSDRDGGAQLGAIDPAGTQIWWFAEQDGERGRWLCSAFDPATQPPQTGFVDLAPAYAGGLAVGRDVVAGGLISSAGSAVWRRAHADATPEQIYQHPVPGLWVHSLSPDERLLTISHEETMGSRNYAVRVLSTIDGTELHHLHDPDASLLPLGFSATGNRVLIQHADAASQKLLIWDLATDTTTELPIAADDTGGADLDARWAADDAVIISRWRAGRSQLLRCELGATPVEIPIPPGVIDRDGLAPQADGSILLHWSSAAHPWTILQIDTAGHATALELPGHTPGPASVPVDDYWIPGEGGPIHTLVSKPSTGNEPAPTVILLHGGPHRADADEYQPTRAAWIDAGYVVVQPNYRGSSGYGGAWKDAIVGAPGTTELQDIVTVHTWCVDNGIADPDRCVVAGLSWGGFLALLAGGRAPELWRAVIGELPLADFARAYDEMMDPMRQMAAGLFGGTPQDVPQRYRDASPASYASDVAAPVLVVAAENDARCPIGQIEGYVEALTNAGKTVEFVRLDSGHQRRVTAHAETLIELPIQFAREHVPAAAAS